MGGIDTKRLAKQSLENARWFVGAAMLVVVCMAVSFGMVPAVPNWFMSLVRSPALLSGLVSASLLTAGAVLAGCVMFQHEDWAKHMPRLPLMMTAHRVVLSAIVLLLVCHQHYFAGLALSVREGTTQQGFQAALIAIIAIAYGGFILVPAPPTKIIVGNPSTLIAALAFVQSLVVMSSGGDYAQPVAWLLGITSILSLAVAFMQGNEVCMQEDTAPSNTPDGSAADSSDD